MSRKTRQIARAKSTRENIAPGSAWGDDPGYSVADAAVAIGVSRKALYDYVTARKIEHVCLGGKKIIRRSHIAAFIARGEVKAV